MQDLGSTLLRFLACIDTWFGLPILAALAMAVSLLVGLGLLLDLSSPPFLLMTQVFEASSSSSVGWTCLVS